MFILVMFLGGLLPPGLLILLLNLLKFSENHEATPKLFDFLEMIPPENLTSHINVQIKLLYIMTKSLASVLLKG